jgi:hypothetical protein
MGLLLFGLGTGLQRGWLIVDWNRLNQDLKIPSLGTGKSGEQPLW